MQKNNRARYTNMVPQQRQAIHNRPSACNRKPEKKQVNRDQYKTRRTPHVNPMEESIAMMNPFYNPMEGP